MLIKGIKLFKKQQEIIANIIKSKKRYVALNASRQFSKSTILENLLMHYALNNTNSKALYVTPTYSLCKIVMNKLYANLIESGVIKTFNKSDNLMTFVNGSEIYFRSAQTPDTIRGLSVHYVYIDEAAFQADEVWNIVRPTMNVIGIQCVMASTPRGRQGFFYQACQLAQQGNENYLYQFGHYTENPFYNIQEVEDAKQTLPDNVYRQEYLAEFLEDGGSVFRNIFNCATLNSFKFNSNETPYSIGIDLGRQQDWTVVTVLNKFKEVVEIYRDNRKDWTTLISAINATIRKYPGAVIMCETTGIGDVVYDLLKRTNNNIHAFLTTHESKNEIIEELILAFETGEIKIPTESLFPQLTHELNSYSFTYSTKTRRIIYNAISGAHDDCVMSLAIALKGKKRGSGRSFSVIK